MWSVASATRSHTMAADIIDRDKTVPSVTDLDHQRILGAPESHRLQRFCADPSSKDAILRDEDMVDEPGQLPGTKAHSKGSLAGFLIAHHETERPALEDREIEMLRKWFESGEAGMDREE